MNVEANPDFIHPNQAVVLANLVFIPAKQAITASTSDQVNLSSIQETTPANSVQVTLVMVQVTLVMVQRALAMVPDTQDMVPETFMTLTMAD